MDVLITVDIVLMTIQDERLKVVLLKRDKDPHAGSYALPGGFVHVEEDVNTRATAQRVLNQKLGLTGVYMEQLRCFSGKFRDDRAWSVSDVYYALVPFENLKNCQHLIELDDTHSVRPLPFDHNEIVGEAISRIKNMSAYSTLPIHFFGEKFTLPVLQRIYEIIMEKPINKVSFRRKMAELGVVPSTEFENGRPNRNSQYYCLADDVTDTVVKLDRGF